MSNPSEKPDDDTELGSTDLLSSWHGEPVDDYGNVACNECGKVQSPDFKRCIDCCDHAELEFEEEWDEGWRITVACSLCGKDHGFGNSLLMARYKVVLKDND